jgi:hypothetical protein
LRFGGFSGKLPPFWYIVPRKIWQPWPFHFSTFVFHLLGTYTLT